MLRLCTRRPVRSYAIVSVWLAVLSLAASAPIVVHAQVAIGPSYVGATDSGPIEIWVGGARVFLFSPDPTSPNLVGGFQDNYCSAGVIGGTIAGGGEETETVFQPLVNRVTDDFGFIGGGRANQTGDDAGSTYDRAYGVVAGGTENRAMASISFIGGGAANVTGSTSDASGSVVVGGVGNQSNGGKSTVGGGQNNRANGDLSTIPGGSFAVASLTGELAYAVGGFENGKGTAQSSVFILRAVTDNDTPTELLINEYDLLEVPPDQTWAFEVRVVARSAAGVSAGYAIEGVIERDGMNNTSLVGSTTTEVLAEEDASWDVTVDADDTNEALRIRGTGTVTDTVRWVAKVEVVRVTY